MRDNWHAHILGYILYIRTVYKWGPTTSVESHYLLRPHLIYIHLYSPCNLWKHILCLDGIDSNDIIASLNNPQIHAGACSFMLEQTLFMLCLMAESLGRQMYRKHNFSRLGVGTTFGTWERNLKPVEDVCWSTIVDIKRTFYRVDKLCFTFFFLLEWGILYVVIF